MPVSTALDLITRAGGIWYTYPMPGGGIVYFRTMLPGYSEAFELDASNSAIVVETPYNSGGALKLAMMGSASYQGGGMLKRVLPYTSAYYPGDHYLFRMDLAGYQGERPDAASIFSNPTTGWPNIQGFAQYRLQFRPLNYVVLSDDAAKKKAYSLNGRDGDGNLPDPVPNPPPDQVAVPELLRFVNFHNVFIPESRKTPTSGFNCYYDAARDTFVPPKPFDSFTIQEVGSLPTFQNEITATLMHWPYYNLPWDAIEQTTGTVNSAPMHLDGRIYPTGTLLFKGLGGIHKYRWIDTNFYCGCPYVFGYRPTTWNTHRKNDGRWMPICIKGTEPGTGDGTKKPQFLSSDHKLLFQPQPGAAP